MTQETNDKKHLIPMITTIVHQSVDRPSQVLADAGYCSNESLTAIAAINIGAFIATGKQKHGEQFGRVRAAAAEGRDDHPSDGPHTAHEAGRGGVCNAQRDRRIGYQADQERVGISAILLRGFENVQREWSVCAQRTILKLYGLCI